MILSSQSEWNKERDAQQRVLVKDRQHFVGVNDVMVIIDDHTPSWERPGRSTKGRAEFGWYGNREYGWVAFTVAERGDKSSREVMVTLRKTAGRALYEYLATIYGDEVPHANAKRDKRESMPRDPRAIRRRATDIVRVSGFIPALKFLRAAERAAGRHDPGLQKGMEMLRKWKEESET